MFSNLLSLSVCSCLPQPIPLRAGPFLSITFPSDTPSFILVRTAVQHVSRTGWSPYPKFTLAFHLHCCTCATPTLCLDFCIQMWKQDPRSEEFRENAFAPVWTVHSFRSMCILFTKAANESTFLSPRSLFRNSSNICMLLLMQNSQRLTLLITAQTRQLPSKIIVILGEVFF